MDGEEVLGGARYGDRRRGRKPVVVAVLAVGARGRTGRDVADIAV